MKIIKKSKILPSQCKKCGTVFRASPYDLEHSTYGRLYAYCPVCRAVTYVEIKKPKTLDRRADDES